MYYEARYSMKQILRCGEGDILWLDLYLFIIKGVRYRGEWCSLSFNVR